MGIFFDTNNAARCCLCGSSENLTGEHKIKASALRAEFGNERMVIGRFAEPNDRAKSAQSVKSKALQFAARMCANCNNSLTQAPDREFDRFHAAAKALIAKGEDPKLVFDCKKYENGSAAYLDVFRYFAKLLCCQLAELGAPRPIHMSSFAMGQNHTNCVWLDINKDWIYQKSSSEFGSHQYAAHGGLVIYGDKKSGAPNAFHSTLSVGSLRYVFFSRLNWFERTELRLNHREFYDWCRAKVEEAKHEPLSEEDLLKLGLAATEHPNGDIS